MPRPTTPDCTSDPIDDCHAPLTTARSSMSGLSLRVGSRGTPTTGGRGAAHRHLQQPCRRVEVAARIPTSKKPLSLRPMGFGIDASRVHNPSERAWGRLRPRADTLHQLAVLQVSCGPVSVQIRDCTKRKNLTMIFLAPNSHHAKHAIKRH
jgi:hypothetical protein